MGAIAIAAPDRVATVDRQAARWTVTDRLIHAVEHGISDDEHTLVKRRSQWS